MSFQVIAVNVQGLGGKTRSKLNNKTKKVSYKIKELISSTRYIPTFYILSETKRKCNFARLNLPNHVHYIGGEMDNNLPDGSSCTVHQGPAELYQEGFTELGRLTDRCQTKRCPWSSRLGVRLRADNPIPEKLHLLQKH